MSLTGSEERFVSLEQLHQMHCHRNNGDSFVAVFRGYVRMLIPYMVLPHPPRFGRVSD